MARGARGGRWVLGKYLLFQLPGWSVAALVLVGLVRWWEVSPRVALILFGIWVAKDFVLYPFVRIAYEPGPGGAADAVVGRDAVAQEELAPEGYVRLGAELWRAELSTRSGSVPPGATVRVVAVRGLTLLVEPQAEGSPGVGHGPER